MKILLDTHVLIWVSENNTTKLNKKVVAEILNPKNDVYFSVASLWEIAIKKKLGKIEVDLDELVASLEKMNIIKLSIEIEHVLHLSKLPNYHRDPFDRILIAQSLSEIMKLFTHDSVLGQYTPDLIQQV